jgi:hypothetical protein
MLFQLVCAQLEILRPPVYPLWFNNLTFDPKVSKNSSNAGLESSKWFTLAYFCTYYFQRFHFQSVDFLCNTKHQICTASVPFSSHTLSTSLYELDEQRNFMVKTVLPNVSLGI